MKDNKTNAGMLRQLFREMPEDKTFTAKDLADMFEKLAPFDKEDVLAKHIRETYSQEQPKDEICPHCGGDHPYDDEVVPKKEEEAFYKFTRSTNSTGNPPKTKEQQPTNNNMPYKSQEEVEEEFKKLKIFSVAIPEDKSGAYTFVSDMQTVFSFISRQRKEDLLAIREMIKDEEVNAILDSLLLSLNKIKE
jgi:hypothetical protein